MKETSQFEFVHRFEPASQAGAPTLLLLHGSGGDENSLLALGRAIAPGSALLCPRGKVCGRGHSRFFARDGNPSSLDPEIKERTSELVRFATEACKAYRFPEPPILVGFSNGANIAVHLLLNASTPWTGAILMRGMAADDHSPHNNLRSTPVLILSGIDDPLVQADQAEDLAVQLRNAGANVTLHWEQTGHNLSQGDVLMAFDWMRQFYRAPQAASAPQ